MECYIKIQGGKMIEKKGNKKPDKNVFDTQAFSVCSDNLHNAYAVDCIVCHFKLAED